MCPDSRICYFAHALRSCIRFDLYSETILSNFVFEFAYNEKVHSQEYKKTYGVEGRSDPTLSQCLGAACQNKKFAAFEFIGVEF